MACLAASADKRLFCQKYLYQLIKSAIFIVSKAQGGKSDVLPKRGKKIMDGSEYYAGCRTIKGSSTAMTLAQTKAAGYKPCCVCNPPA